MSDINKCKEMLQEIDVFFKQEFEESAVIYRKSVSTYERNEKHKQTTPKLVCKKLTDVNSTEKTESKETPKLIEKALPLLTPFEDSEYEKPGDETTKIIDRNAASIKKTPKQTEKAITLKLTPFGRIDDEKLDKETPKIVGEKVAIKTEAKETPKLIEKALPLMLIPYVGSPLAHDRRPKRRCIDFNAEESDTEDESNTVFIIPKRKYNAKRLRLENSTEL